MLMRSVCIDKRIGQTPLEAIQEWKRTHPDYKDIPASYAGRLDPMASGKLLVLLGDECKKQKNYTQLDKEYEIRIVLDVGTDTGDMLGIATYANTVTMPEMRDLRRVLRSEQGVQLREYPVFSSKTVAGKPLFLYALEKSLDTISLPTHKETIYRIQLLDHTEISAQKLQNTVQELLALAPRSDEPSKALGADFRINDVRTSWEAVFKAAEERSFTLLTLRVTCASGTYMRSLAARIGAALGTRAFALSIHRSGIGRYKPLWYNLPKLGKNG